MSNTVTRPRLAMPKGWKNPMRQPLYRVVVEMRGEPMPVAVSPGMLRDYADMVADAVKAQVQAGKLPGWGSPTVVPCHV